MIALIKFKGKEGTLQLNNVIEFIAHPKTYYIKVKLEKAPGQEWFGDEATYSIEIKKIDEIKILEKEKDNE